MPIYNFVSAVLVMEIKMSLIGKLTTALRGGLRESAEVLVDANGLRIFAQEIYECEQKINQSKQQLALIIAQRIQVKRERDQLQNGVILKEKKIASLLEQKNEGEALQLAELIAEKEPILKRQQQHHQQLVDYENKLQLSLKKMVSRLNSYRSEYQMRQATESLQTVQRKLSTNNHYNQSKFADLEGSLDRIQRRQQQFSDQECAMEQVDAYLDESEVNGIIEEKSKAKDILEAIRCQQKTP